MNRPELFVHGVPETALTAALVEHLPVNAAAAPWNCSAEAVFWLGRGGTPATAALPPLLRGKAHALAVIGGFVRYTETPVGSYDEVLGAVAFRQGLRPRGHVAFMAVDSETSLVGGRTNWAMPKTLASFSGDLACGTMTATEVVGGAPKWTVGVTAHAFGFALPLRATGTVLQQLHTDDIVAAQLRTRGRVKFALIDTSVDGDGDLPAWLRPGRHLGVLIPHLQFTLSSPARVRVGGSAWRGITTACVGTERLDDPRIAGSQNLR
ncbi:acetoacetate decarboxylase family protein [Nocardia sp. NBC_01388]|uniref:acetoacetate decarboxylase family protein n=1 Tax=Nocardia sp. NBC_01388 TaxID=2903596 RepID=UPI0032439681